MVISRWLDFSNTHPACDTVRHHVTMTLVGEAIARYHKLIESEPYIDLGWAQALQERKRALKLDNGPLAPACALAAPGPNPDLYTVHFQ